MCTVVIEVPEAPGDAIRVLAVRDEDPGRAWDPPGLWWDDRPGVIGVRDRLAGGAWLASLPAEGRLAVVLNRADVYSAGLPAPSGGLRSRGTIVLEDVAGRGLPSPPETAGFNLVSVAGGRVMVSSWDGERLVEAVLSPGVHMIAHHDVDDPRTARIVAWLPEFRAASSSLTGPAHWRDAWLEVLARSAMLSVEDDRAIIRDNHVHGYGTLSLLVCTAEVRDGVVDEFDYAVLAEPAHWDSPSFQPAETVAAAG